MPSASPSRCSGSARSNEAHGQPAQAIETHARFVALWKDADRELQPQVIEARRRIERLRAGTG
ncbi:MAG: hypothetical protein JWL60_920 [Gemmatimonadetes bacterium]|jgi:hypothetical protein|nr:hypothetical protein [Gemmatimonadota bacterium]